MQASVQTGGRSASPLSRSKSNPEHPPSPAYSASGRSRKRDRSDRSVDSSSKRKTPKEHQEISSLVDKDGGLVNCAGVERLHLLMQQDLNKSSRKLKEVVSRRTSLAAVIAATVRHDCLNRFVQLGGLPLLNEWLQEAHKGKLGDGGNSNESGRAIDDLILTLLHALEKLPLDFNALKSSNAPKSVKSLRSHTNSKIHRKAKKLIDAWKKRVDAEIKQSEEAETASKQDNCRPYKLTMPKDPHNILKNGGSVDANVRSSGTFGNTVKTTTTNISSSMGEVAISLKKSGASTKESPNRMPSSNSPHAEIDSASFPDERSSNSNQTLSNGPTRSTGPMKNTVSNGKEDSKFSTNNAATTKTGNSRSNISSKGISVGAGVNTGSKEVGSGKPLVRTMSASMEKKIGVPVTSDKISNESTKAEACSNQRIILRLPNTVRSSVGNSFADVVVPSSRDSSANITDRNLDSKEIKSRLQNTCTDTSSIKASALRDDDIEKHVDLPKQRTEMECHSSESHLSFSSTECCTLDFKKSYHHQEGQPMNSRTRESLKQTSDKFDGCGTEDVNAGISLLASIAADENMRLEADAALITFEKKKNSKSVEIRHQDTKTACLTDSENSPMSDITENSGRMEVVPDPDVKDVLENSEYIRPSSDGVPDLEMTAAPIDADLGQSDESMKTSEGHCSESRPCERKLEGSSGLPLNDRKSSESLNTMLTSSALGKSLDENRHNENDGSPDSVKDCSILREIGLEDKKNQSDLSIQSKRDAATSVNISSAIDQRYGNPGGEERAEMNSDIARESMYRFPGEDALEVAMQVAKEVEEEMESYGKASLEKENNLEVSTSHKKIVPFTDHPESKVADEHKQKSTEWKKDDEKDDYSDMKSFRGAKEENLRDAEVKETDQTKPCPVKRQSTVGVEGLDPQVVEPCLPDDSDKANHTAELQHGCSPSAEFKESAKAELSTAVEAPGMLKFDLNEGLHLEDSPHETTTALSYPIASIPITPVASHPMVSSRSSFIPPLQVKGELGWRGSAATSAFRPAEPRKTPERSQNAIESTASNVPSTSKPARPLFDLNIAHDDPEEEASNPVSHHAQQSSGSRLDLDLNRVDEGEENCTVLASEIINNEGHGSSGRSKTVKHDFDLNAGLCLEDAVAVDPVDSRTNLWISGYPGLKMPGEMINLPPWNQQPGSTFPSPAMPTFASVKQETPFTGSFTPAYFNVGQGHGIPPFHPDMCRPPAELSSASAAALPYPSPSPHAFPYAGYPFGFSSASFPASTSFLDSSGSASYSPLATQFLTSGAMLPSHPRPPYLTGFAEIGGAVSSNGIWARPSLDLNAGPSFDLNSGPELVDADAREERTTVRQVPTFGNLSYLDPHMRVLRQSVEPSDAPKKECEGAWDLYKADAGPELKNLDARDERLRQATIFGNRFSLEEHRRPEHRVFRSPEATESSLKRKEPEGGWDAYRAGLKQQPQWR